jgi:hypothetical protein
MDLGRAFDACGFLLALAYPVRGAAREHGEHGYALATIPGVSQAPGFQRHREQGSPVGPQRTVKVAKLANWVEHEVAKRRALVFIVARIGRDPGSLPRGVWYTHAGFAVYGDLRRSDGVASKGYVIYNLYQRPDA